MTDEHHTQHLPQWKKDEVESIKKLIGDYSVFGTVAIRGISSSQMQAMRRELKGTALLKISRNSLINKAFSDLGMNELVDHVEDQTALIFTNNNPFKLYKFLASSKTPAPLKGGSASPVDVTVQAGPTSFPPGPIVGNLQQAGISAAIAGGKVVIKKTETVVKVGDIVSNNLADMLSKLEIYPLEVGLILRAAYEGGAVIIGSDLEIDEDKYFNDFMSAVQQGINLSVNGAYPTKDTITILLASAARSGTNLGVNAVIYTADVMDSLMAKAQAEMMSLATNLTGVDGALDEELSVALGAAQAAAAVIIETTTDDVQDAEATEEGDSEEENEEEGMAGLGALFG